MKLEIEFEDGSPTALALEQLAEEGIVETVDGQREATPEDIAENAIRQAVGQQFQQLIQNGR